MSLLKSIYNWYCDKRINKLQKKVNNIFDNSQLVYSEAANNIEFCYEERNWKNKDKKSMFFYGMVTTDSCIIAVHNYAQYTSDYNYKGESVLMINNKSALVAYNTDKYELVEKKTVELPKLEDVKS